MSHHQKKSKSDVIKSHHNVGGLPKDMRFELVEPIRDLFKDEVRKIGRKLGLPSKPSSKDIHFLDPVCRSNTW